MEQPPINSQQLDPSQAQDKDSTLIESYIEKSTLEETKENIDQSMDQSFQKQEMQEESKIEDNVHKEEHNESHNDKYASIMHSIKTQIASSITQHQQTQKMKIQLDFHRLFSDPKQDFIIGKQLLSKKVQNLFNEEYIKHKILYINKKNKYQIVKEIDHEQYFSHTHSSDIRNYISERSLQYKIIEDIRKLADQQGSQIFQIKVLQPFELVVKVPIINQDNIKLGHAFNEQLYDSNLLNVLNNSKHICQIKEEIIEHNKSNNKIYSYITIAEQAKMNLEEVLSIWEKGALNQDIQYLDAFTEEKLSYYCFKAMQAINYMHGKYVYYGDIKALNLQVFDDYNIKLGSFSTCIQYDKESLTSPTASMQLRGMTKQYSDPVLYNKFIQEELVSVQELINNDYYSLWSTFHIIKDKYVSKLSKNSYFYSQIHDLKSILNGEKSFKEIMIEYKRVFADDIVFIQKLCNQLIAEDKLKAIFTILDLTKYQIIFNRVKLQFEQLENKELDYVNSSNYLQNDEEVNALHASVSEQFNLKMFGTGVKNKLSQLEQEMQFYEGYQKSEESILDQYFQDHMDSNIEELDTLIVYLHQYQGSLQKTEYKNVIYMIFKNGYPHLNQKNDINWSNLLNLNVEQLSKYCKTNVKEFKRFCYFYFNTQFDEMKFRLLIQVADFLKLYQEEFDYLIAYNQNLIQSVENIEANDIAIHENISSCLQLNLHIRHLNQDMNKLKQTNIKNANDSKLLETFIQFEIKKILNNGNQMIDPNYLEDVKKQLKEFQIDNQKYFKYKAFYAYWYRLKSIIYKKLNNLDNYKKSLIKERQSLKRLFGDQGELILKNSKELYKLYTSNNVIANSLYYARKLIYHSSKTQRLKFLDLISEQLFRDGYFNELTKTLVEFNSISEGLKIVMHYHFNCLSEIDQDDYQELHDYNQFLLIINEYSCYKHVKDGLMKMVNCTDFKNIMNCYTVWRAMQEKDYYEKFDVQEYFKTSNQYEKISKANGTQAEAYIKFPNQIMYKGAIENWKLQGKGKLDYPDGSFYEGDFVQNIKQGEGMFSYPDFNFYKGVWEQNQFKEGTVDLKYPDQNKYEGEFKDNKRNGQGYFYFTEKDYYQGQWNQDLFDGPGTYKTELFTFEGNFNMGLIEGPGKIDFHLGDQPKEGQAENGVFLIQESVQTNLMYSTNGIKLKNLNYLEIGTFQNGSLVNGEIFTEHLEVHVANGKWNGQGKIDLQNGYVYEGDLENNNFGENGAITQKKNFKIFKMKRSGLLHFFGALTENDFTGKGIQMSIDGYLSKGNFMDKRFIKGYIKQIHYEGKVANGLYNGIGTYKFGQGIQITGDFLNGTIHGLAKIGFPNGLSYYCIFDRGNQTVVGILRQNEIKIKLAELDKNVFAYGIELKDGKYHGTGILIQLKGSIYHGDFNQDEFVNGFKLGPEYSGAVEHGQRQQEQQHSQSLFKYDEECSHLQVTQVQTLFNYMNYKINKDYTKGKEQQEQQNVMKQGGIEENKSPLYQVLVTSDRDGSVTQKRLFANQNEADPHFPDFSIQDSREIDLDQASQYRWKTNEHGDKSPISQISPVFNFQAAKMEVFSESSSDGSVQLANFARSNWQLQKEKVISSCRTKYINQLNQTVGCIDNCKQPQLFDLATLNFGQKISNENSFLKYITFIDDCYIAISDPNIVLKFDLQFELVASMKVKTGVYNLYNLNDQYVIVGQQSGFIQIIQSEKLKVVETYKMKIQRSVLDIKKCQGDNNQFIVSTACGLYIIDINNKYQITELKEEVYFKTKGITSVFEFKPEFYLVFLHEDPQLYILDRKRKTEMKQAKIQSANICSFKICDIGCYDYDTMPFVFLREQMNVYVLNVKNFQFKIMFGQSIMTSVYNSMICNAGEKGQIKLVLLEYIDDKENSKVSLYHLKL